MGLGSDSFSATPWACNSTATTINHVYGRSLVSVNHGTHLTSTVFYWLLHCAEKVLLEGKSL